MSKQSKFLKSIRKRNEIQYNLVFSGVFVREFVDSTMNSSQIRVSCSGDWLLATNYVLWVLQEQA